MNFLAWSQSSPQLTDLKYRMACDTALSGHDNGWGEPLTFLINPLHAKFFRGNINIYSHFVSFLHIDATQAFEILPQIRQEHTYST